MAPGTGSMRANPDYGRILWGGAVLLQSISIPACKLSFLRSSRMCLWKPIIGRLTRWNAR
ncbi:hypothetical protein H206_06350 [Candidatus Electrothrix aarhusensis]|uniref:Uncharacterized protein n=1 Tax=Candidatus Electrothrix aarhusensis TaxID=1859131 RepID=A0A3S3R9M4_9BACT|nr:hypothetical protein H206_06350 [Candidatus Electrothrix aarhusensis]